jgi:hypothetical protein
MAAPFWMRGGSRPPSLGSFKELEMDKTQESKPAAEWRRTFVLVALVVLLAARLWQYEKIDRPYLELRNRGVTTLATVTQMAADGVLKYQFKVGDRTFVHSGLFESNSWASVSEDRWAAALKSGQIEVTYLPEDPATNRVGLAVGPKPSGGPLSGAMALLALTALGYMLVVRLRMR